MVTLSPGSAEVGVSGGGGDTEKASSAVDGVLRVHLYDRFLIVQSIGGSSAEALAFVPDCLTGICDGVSHCDALASACSERDESPGERFTVGESHSWHARVAGGVCVVEGREGILLALFEGEAREPVGGSVSSAAEDAGEVVGILTEVEVGVKQWAAHLRKPCV